MKTFSRKASIALAEWFSWLECCPVYEKVAGLIAGQGGYRRQPINVSHVDGVFSLFLPSSLSKINKRVLR